MRIFTARGDSEHWALRGAHGPGIDWEWTLIGYCCQPVCGDEGSEGNSEYSVHEGHRNGGCVCYEEGGLLLSDLGSISKVRNGMSNIAIYIMHDMLIHKAGKPATMCVERLAFFCR